MEAIDSTQPRDWRPMITGGVVFVGLVLAYLAIHRAQSANAASLADYNRKLELIDPAQVELWKSASAYEELGRDLRALYAPEGRWGEVVPLDILIESVKFDPQWIKRIEEVGGGHSLDELLYSVVVDRIPEAGPSPFPPRPTTHLNTFFAVCQLASIGLVGGGTLAYTWKPVTETSPTG